MNEIISLKNLFTPIYHDLASTIKTNTNDLIEAKFKFNIKLTDLNLEIMFYKVYRYIKLEAKLNEKNVASCSFQVDGLYHAAKDFINQIEASIYFLLYQQKQEMKQKMMSVLTGHHVIDVFDREERSHPYLSHLFNQEYNLLVFDSKAKIILNGLIKGHQEIVYDDMNQAINDWFQLKYS